MDGRKKERKEGRKEKEERRKDRKKERKKERKNKNNHSTLFVQQSHKLTTWNNARNPANALSKLISEFFHL